MFDGQRGTASRARRAVRRESAQEGETMSALHRLKAYFGMVPAEEFDADPFDADRFDEAQFGAAEFDGYHSGHRSGYPSSGYDRKGQGSGRNHVAYAHQAHDPVSEGPAHRGAPRVAAEHYEGGYPASAAHHAVSRMQPSRPSSAPMNSRGHSTRAAAPWAAEAPVRGSLAIDTAAADPVRMDSAHIETRARIETRPSTHQPIVPQPFVHEPRADLLADDEAHSLSRIVTLHPHSYNEARPIGERYREGNPVIMNLTAMADRDAKRLVDFAAGLAFALRGSIDKITNKVFLLSPPNVEMSAEDRRRIAEGRLFS